MRVTQTGTNPVQSNQTSEAGSARQSGRTEKVKNGDKPSSSDASSAIESAKAEISSKAKDFAKAKEVASDAPDVREAKIEELKKRIAAGKYNVDPHAVADRMVDDHLKMSGIG